MFFFFFLFLSQCCAYGLVRLGLGTEKYLVRVKKTSCLATTAGDGLSSTEKHLVLSPQNGWKFT